MPVLQRSRLRLAAKLPFGTAYPTKPAFIGAFTLYIGIIFTLFWRLYSYEPPQKFTNDLNAFMDILVVETPKVAQKVMTPKPQKQVATELPKIEPITTPKPAKQISPEPAANLSDLFGEIKPVELPKQEAVQANRPQEQLPQKSAADILKSLQNSPNTSAPKSQSTGEYNKLIGDILEIIQARWVAYRADSNAVASVRVRISESGAFSYSVISWSLDSSFNAKVRDLLEQLKYTDFPAPDQAITLKINLKDEIELVQ